MNNDYISIKNELDSIMVTFEEMMDTFDSAVSLITDNCLVNGEKYGNKEIGSIYNEEREIRRKKREIDRKVKASQ